MLLVNESPAGCATTMTVNQAALSLGIALGSAVGEASVVTNLDALRAHLEVTPGEDSVVLGPTMDQTAAFRRGLLPRSGWRWRGRCRSCWRLPQWMRSQGSATWTAVQ